MRHKAPALRFASFAAGLLILAAQGAVGDDGLQKDMRPSIAPDIREDELEVKLQRGDFVVVPIPTSNPTLGTGLVGGAAYFYSQSEEQKSIQPASLTGIGGLYTDNDSKALAIVQQNYWRSNKWRFTGAAGAADLRLSLLSPDGAGSFAQLDWRVKGQFAYARVSGQVRPNWYAGLLGRLVDAKQSLETPLDIPEFDLIDQPYTSSIGLGIYAEYDTRDMPTNAYSGRYLKAEALFNDESIGSKRTYQNYSLTFNSYHQLSDSLVIAWQLQGCTRGGRVPLWDACTVKLRGFAATDYLGTSSYSGQVEARWRLSERWGLAGFGGGGYSLNALGQADGRDAVESYGAGIRFMVLKSKRVNMRLDFARSGDSEAIHFTVGEAF